jgi:hypothetical protein
VSRCLCLSPSVRYAIILRPSSCVYAYHDRRISVAAENMAQLLGIWCTYGHPPASGWTDMVWMEQAASEREASEREALPDEPPADAPPAATSVSEKQGGKQEAEGMGAPFGLAL